MSWKISWKTLSVYGYVMKNKLENNLLVFKKIIKIIRNKSYKLKS
jgi:hypothetical protein